MKKPSPKPHWAPKTHWSPKTQSGFTLVEIAIVLVIVGLLLGGVLKGQELIFNSKVKATYNLSKELSAAVNGYQDRYKQLPGDDPNALTRFPTYSPTVVNGDGDGLIWWAGTCQTGQQSGENCRAMSHLRASGFISGTGPEGAPSPFGGTASVASALIFMPGAGGSPVLGLSPQSLTHKSASAMDTSFDDGLSTTGSIRCRSLAAYNMATPDTNVPDWCSIQM
jgi:prepilin-type N-terminal cleavage/methylation domain-containing protein